MDRSTRIGATLLTATTLVCVLAACSSPPKPVESTTETPISYFLDQARKADVASEQIDVLEKADAAGEISYQDVSALMAPFADCLENAGLALLRVDDDVVGQDFKVPGYSMAYTNPGLTEEASGVIATKCENDFVVYAITALRNSPSAVTSIDAMWTAHRSEVVECLAKNGISVDDAASIDELRNIETDAFTTTGISCEPT